MDALKPQTALNDKETFKHPTTCLCLYAAYTVSESNILLLAAKLFLNNIPYNISLKHIHWYTFICIHYIYSCSCISPGTLKHTACCVIVLADVRDAWQGLEVLHLPPGILLVMLDVVNDISCHHGEPAEHGHKHGHIGCLVVEVAKVDPRVQDLNHRFSHILLLHRSVATDIVHCLWVKPQLPQDLLQRAFAVPQVVGEADTSVELYQGLFRKAAEVVVRKVQGPETF